MTQLRLSLVFLFILGAPAVASTALDGAYRLKTIIPLVLDVPKYPVYSEHVEAELVKMLSKHSRFELPMPLYYKARKLVPPKSPSIKNLMAEDWQALPVLWEKLDEEEIDAVLFTEIKKLKAEGYRVRVALVNTFTRETIVTAKSDVTSKILLEDFTNATRDAVRQVVESIPYDGNILKRDGYLVILDKGAPLLSNGMRLPTYTLERDSDRLTLVETGRILLTKVEDNISFGKITLEKKPYEVNEENKIVIPGVPKKPAAIFRPPTNSFNRSLASIGVVEDFKSRRTGIGHVELDLTGTLVTFNTLQADGTGATAANNFFPGGRLRGEIWLSRNWIAELNIGFAMATLENSSVTASASDQNATITSTNGFIAYHLPLGQSALSPTVRLRGGFTQQGYSVDTSPNAIAFASTTYRGASIGTSVNIPISSRLKFGVDVGTLLIGSVSEFPQQSGARSTGVSSWNFALGGTYHWSDQFDVGARLIFQSDRANFEDANGGSATYVSTSQSMRALSLGLAYYF